MSPERFVKGESERTSLESRTCSHFLNGVVRQNFSRDQERDRSWWSRPEYEPRLDTARNLSRGGIRVRVRRAYILRMGGKLIRTRRLDRNDGAIRRVARQKVPDPKLRNESCRQVSPSQVRDACDPHDGNEHTPRAIASDGVH